MFILCNAGALTVAAKVALSPDFSAVRVTFPALTDVTKPVAEIVAMPALPDDHATSLKSWVTPLLKEPLAVNCSVVPKGTEELPLLLTTAMLSKVGGRIVISTLLLSELLVAVIVVVPSATPVNTPDVLIEATLAVDDDQVIPERAAVVPLL